MTGGTRHRPDATRGERLDQFAVRRSNLARTLQSVLGRPQSKAQIAAGTGLTKGAVGGLVGELTERGLVRVAAEALPVAVGRPGRLVHAVPDRVHAIGLSLSVVYLVGVVADLGGRPVIQEQIPLDWDRTTPESLVEAVVDLVKALVERAEVLMPDSLVAGLAVGVPDLVESAEGIVRRSPTTGLQDYPLRAVLESRLHGLVPQVDVDNDANYGALAEMHDRAHEPIRNLVYVTGSYGVGGGIIAERTLYSGSGGFAGEIGHLPVNPGGLLCSCGSRGCLEAEVGLARFLERVAHLDPRISDRRVPVDELVSLVIEGARRDDERTIRAIEDVARHLATGLTGVINVLSPDRVVLGGYFARLFEFLAPRLDESLRERVMPEILQRCRIEPSQNVTHAAALGAARWTLQRVTTDPTRVPRAARLRTKAVS